jgi:hypothetical protein
LAGGQTFGLVGEYEQPWSFNHGTNPKSDAPQPFAKKGLRPH